MDAAADAVAIRPFERADTDAVLAVWRDAFPQYDEAGAPPHRDPLRSIELKLATQPELFFVATSGAHRSRRRTSRASRDVRRNRPSACRRRALAALGCLKINLQVLPGNDDACRFYAALGYRVEERISFGKTLSAA